MFHVIYFDASVNFALIDMDNSVVHVEKSCTYNY